MRMQKLVPGDEERLEAFLAQYPASSMFLRSNMRASGLGGGTEPFHGDYFAALDDDGTLQGVMAFFWNGNIVVQYPNATVLNELTHTVSHNATQALAGIIGPEQQAQSIIQFFSIPEDRFALNSVEPMYLLDLQKIRTPHHPEHSRFSVDGAHTTDPNLLTRWFADYELEALGSEHEESRNARARDRTARAREGGDLWTLYCDQTPVSLSGFNARLPDVVQVGPVWTPPEHRQKGYARYLLAKTLERAREEHVRKAILFTHNPYAARAYEAIGFEPLNENYCISILSEPMALS